MPFPTDEQRIVEAEAQLGVSLPCSYRRRLMASNGGEVQVSGQTWWLHPVRDDTSRERLSRSWDDIVRQTRQAREWNGFPSGGVSIGENGGGDRLILYQQGDGELELAQWDHETGDVLPLQGGVEGVFGA